MDILFQTNCLGAMFFPVKASEEELGPWLVEMANASLLEGRLSAFIKEAVVKDICAAKLRKTDWLHRQR